MKHESMKEESEKKTVKIEIIKLRQSNYLVTIFNLEFKRKSVVLHDVSAF
jgi:hypothetical protein